MQLLNFILVVAVAFVPDCAHMLEEALVDVHVLLAGLDHVPALATQLVDVLEHIQVFARPRLAGAKQLFHSDKCTYSWISRITV